MTGNKFHFGDGEHTFALTMPLIEELERVTDSGVPALMRALYAQTHKVSHLKIILRLALIGGGCEPQRASELVDTYFLPHGLEKCRLMAAVVLGALLAPEGSDDVEVAA